MKLLITSIALSISNCLIAQGLDGLWFSSYQMNIQKTTESVEPVNESLDQIDVDTFYHNAGVVLHFLPDSGLKIKRLGNSEKSGAYRFANDTIFAQIDTTLLKLVSYEERLVLIEPDSGWQHNQLVFERLEPKSSKSLITPDFQSEPYWVVETDTSSFSKGLEFLIVDSTTLMITQINNNYSYTSWGKFEIDIYEGSLYFYFLDGYSLGAKMYRLYNWQKNAFTGQSYEQVSGSTPLQKQSFKFKNQPLPSNETVKLMRKGLIGSWALIEGEIPFESEFLGYHKTENNFFYFSIDDTSFEIGYGGVFTNQDGQKTLSEKLTGTWKLGQTGKYIELELSTGQTEYVTITELREGLLSVNMNLKTPEPGELYLPKMIKLERR